MEKKMDIQVIETHNTDSVEWGISFDGHNPAKRDYFMVVSEEDAFRLQDYLLNCKYPNHARLSSSEPIAQTQTAQKAHP